VGLDELKGAGIGCAWLEDNVEWNHTDPSFLVGWMEQSKMLVWLIG
jgi:hypothetical protein